MTSNGRLHRSGALKYHHSTCHSYSSVRSRARFLDFSTKPPPFKRYQEVPRIPLPPPDESLFEVSALEAIARVGIQDYTPFEHPLIEMPAGTVASSPEPPTQDNPATEGKTSSLAPSTFRSGMSTREISAILKFSMGILRQKNIGGETFAFRAAACTGALYHIECYAATPVLHAPTGENPLAPGLYHYDPLTHSLDVLADDDRRGHLLEASGYRPQSRIQTLLEAGCIVLCYTSVFWRNAWKYEERSFRHAFWDTGTILANAMAVAAALGIGQSLHVAFVDRQVADVVGCDLVHEAPTAILVLLPSAVRERTSACSGALGPEPGSAGAMEAQAQTKIWKEARGASRDAAQSPRGSDSGVEPQAPEVDRSARLVESFAIRQHLTESRPTERRRVAETRSTKEGLGSASGTNRSAKSAGRAEPLPSSHRHYRAIEQAVEATAISELDEVLGFLRRAESLWKSHTKASRNWSVARVANLLEGAGAVSRCLSESGNRADLRAFWRLPAPAAGSGYQESHLIGPDLGSVIANRRSTRLFADSPIELSTFSTLLAVCSLPLPADFLGRSANVIAATTAGGGGSAPSSKLLGPERQADTTAAEVRKTDFDTRSPGPDLQGTEGARQSPDLEDLSSDEESTGGTPAEQEPSKLDDTEGARRTDAFPTDEVGTFAARSLLFQAMVLPKGVVRQGAGSREAVVLEPGVYICLFERGEDPTFYDVRSTYGQGPGGEQVFGRIQPHRQSVASPNSGTANSSAASKADGAIRARSEWQLRKLAAFLALEQAAAGFAALDVFHLADMALVIDALGERGYRAAQLEGGIRGGFTYLAAHAMGLRACGLTFYDHETIRFFFPDPLPQRWKESTERSSAAMSQTPCLPSEAAAALSVERPEGDESDGSCAVGDLEWDLGVMFLTAVGKRRQKSQKVSGCGR